MVHKDCFAYKSRNGKDCCTALKEIDCGGCVFYKPHKAADKPEASLSAAAVSGRKISDETKDKIADMYRNGVKVNAIASNMGVSIPWIYKILKDRLSKEEMRQRRTGR